MAEQILSSEYSDVMQKSYIDYSMSVICQRAVPDVRDGLKPVQRRVLYAMDQLGLNYDKPHRKSARIVGDTMGKYHPHGDSSIYEALVVLEQDFKKGMALVDGHGNFGSIEGDGAAAMRYTEAKLKKFTQDVYLADLDKDVVDFVPNFDETEKEPEVLPVRVPNVLINGAEGIAVGMTTSIPTHNLSEVIDAVIAYMDNNDITTQGLMEYVKGPDFPTGGIVVNKSELPEIYETGTGKIKLRGKLHFEPGKNRSDRDKLIITEIPYTMIGANISKFISDVVGLIESKKTQDIVDVSNQSDKDGIRIVLELKKNADINKLENMLYKKTRLEDTFGVNMLTIADKKPEVLGLKGIIRHNVNFQFELQTRKYNTLLKKELEQKEIKEGLIKACDMIDLIIEILRGSQSLKDAKNCLINGVTDNIKFKHKESELYANNLSFTEKQAQAILDLRLYKLIGLEILALQKEYEAILTRIADYEEILSNRKAMAKVIKKELLKIKKEYAVPRKTDIIDGKEAVYEENPIVEQEVVFLMDRFGYTKSIDCQAYDRNAESVENDNKYVFHVMNTGKVYVFTDTGVMHTIKMQDVPFVKVKDKGTPADNLCKYDSKGESIVFVCSSDMAKDKKLLFTTAQGMMKIVSGNEFDVSKRTIAATKLQDGDNVVSVIITDNSPFTNASIGNINELEEAVMMSGGSSDDMTFENLDENGQMSFDIFDDYEDTGMAGNEDLIVVLQTKDGVFLRFHLNEIPEKKKAAIGVTGIRLKEEDLVNKVYLIDAGDNKVVKCNGKEVNLRDLKTNKRGAKGVKVRGK